MKSLLCLTSMIVLVTANSASAVVITVDDFSAGSLSVTAAKGGTATGSEVAAVLGGVRKFTVVSDGVGVSDAGSTADVTSIPGFAVLANALLETTTWTLDYSGGTGNPYDLTIDAHGLTGTNSWSFVQLSIISGSGLAVDVIATSAGGASSTFSETGVGSGTFTTTTVNHWTHDGGEVNFGAVTSLVFVIKAFSGSDVVVDFSQVGTNLPEPSTLLTFAALGAFGLVFHRRRRK
jgi:hypothetical protein